VREEVGLHTRQICALPKEAESSSPTWSEQITWTPSWQLHDVPHEEQEGEQIPYPKFELVVACEKCRTLTSEDTLVPNNLLFKLHCLVTHAEVDDRMAKRSRNNRQWVLNSILVCGHFHTFNMGKMCRE
jgi:hypothetical protein